MTGPLRRLVPMRYSLRHGFSNKAHPAQLGALRHWVVRARAEASDPWTVLKTHKVLPTPTPCLCLVLSFIALCSLPRHGLLFCALALPPILYLVLQFKIT